MRTMLKIEMDVESANRSIKEGILPKVIQGFINEVKPESTYFFAEDGKRTAQFVFDMKDSSQIPSIAEPFFMALNARVQIQPVMNLEELRKGLDVVSGMTMMRT